MLDPKMGEFGPADAGRMPLYLNLVDDRRRDPGDDPSIGPMLRRSKNAVVAEYARRGATSPMGMAGFRVTDRADALPAELRGARATLEAARAELEVAPLAVPDTEPPTADEANGGEDAPAA